MRPFLVAVGLVLVVPACSAETNCDDSALCREERARANAEAADSGVTGTTAQALQCTTFGKPHLGLGGVDVAASNEGAAAGDRARAKPFTALVTEYSRVLGQENAPASVNSAGNTFGIPNPRWFLEPVLSAVFVSTAFDVAFEGCSKMTTTDPQFQAPPSKDGARTQCATWARQFWSREATPDQLDACVAAATESPDRQWAYACASVLTATGFLTY